MARSLAREVGTVFEGHHQATEKRRMHPEKRALDWDRSLANSHRFAQRWCANVVSGIDGVVDWLGQFK